MSDKLNFPKFLKDMDTVFAAQQPLPEHFISPLDQHTRGLYATMLAAMILVDGNIEEKQSRLFTLFLPAIGLENEQSRIFNQVAQIGHEEIQDFCRLAAEHEFAVSFLADCLIFSRIDSSISEKQNELFNKWCTLLELPESHIQTAMVVAANTLGISVDIDVDYGIDVEKFKIWWEFMYRPLKEIDDSELPKGYWLIDQNVQLNERWILNQQHIYFDTSITVHCNQGFNIKECTLINPKIVVAAESAQCYLGNSRILGEYPVEQLAIAFHFHSNSEKGIAATIEKNTFQTINAQTLRFDKAANLTGISSMTSILDNSFIKCGHEDLSGGGVRIDLGYVRNSSSRERASWRIRNCIFNQCHAYVGGGIFVGTYCVRCIYYNTEDYALEDCYFYDCLSDFSNQESLDKSLAISKNLWGGGLYIRNVEHYYNGYENGKFIYLQNCIFKNSDIHVNSEFQVISRGLLSCKFTHVIFAYSQIKDYSSSYRDGNWEILFGGSSNVQGDIKFISHQQFVEDNPEYLSPNTYLPFSEVRHPRPKFGKKQGVPESDIK